MEIIDQGFSQFVDAQKLKVPEGVSEWGRHKALDLAHHFSFTRKFWDSWENDPEYRRPMIWKVKWESKNFGIQEKRVYLHPLDFNRTSHLEGLFATLGSIDLAAVLITGIGPPPTIDQFLSRLKEDRGVLVFEDFVRDGSRHELLDQLDASGARLVELGLDQEFSSSPENQRGTPSVHTYVISP